MLELLSYLPKFPRVLGVVSCMYINLKKAREQVHAYTNEHLTHSVHMIMICDAQMYFMGAMAKNLGSYHETYILLPSRLCSYFVQIDFLHGLLPGRQWDVLPPS